MHVEGKGYASGSFTHSVAFTVGAVPPTTGSFAGGIQIDIPGTGFNLDATAKVCGFDCPISAIDHNSITCTTPPMPTLYSQSAFNIQATSELYTGGLWFHSDVSNNNHYTNALDGDTTTRFKSIVPDCYIGFNVGDGFIF